MSIAATLAKTETAPVRHRSGRPLRDGGALESSQKRAFGVFVGPALILYTIFFIVPAVVGAVFSVGRWGGPGTDFTWVAAQNYLLLFQDRVFMTAFMNTLVLVGVGGILVFAVVFLAMIVLRDMVGRSFVRSVLFMPHIISMVAIGVCFGFLLDSNGAVNQFLGRIGLPADTAWLGNGTILKVLIVTVMWASTGFFVTLVMAAVDNVPSELYEDAQLAGATRVEQFWHVTLPLTRDAVSIAAVLWVIAAMKTFEMVIALSGQSQLAPIEVRTVVTQQYYTISPPDGSVAQYGYASAMGVLLVALTGVLIVLTRRITSSERIEV